ncbi:MAG: hypothetical protein KJN82_04585 [Bacteroidia bacterium]|nr:hypothetical protein [Bacteroidia bacterium]
MKIGSAILSIILATLIMLSSLRISLTFTYYKLDPVGFIERLCENKYQPELECNGKCHLKKVTQTTTENDNFPINIIDFKELLLYYNSAIKYNLVLDFNYKNNYSKYNNHYSFLNEYNYFHPPKSLVFI